MDPVRDPYLDNMIELINKSSKTSEEIDKIDGFLYNLKPFQRLIEHLAINIRQQVIGCLQVKECKEGERLFTKGDPSDCLYIVMRGSLQMYNHSSKEKNDMIPENVLGKGKILGERGILRNGPRSLTAVAKEHSYVLTLDEKYFKLYLSNEMYNTLETKKKIIDKFIPGLSKYPGTQKERLAYTLEIEDYDRGTILAKQGALTEKMLVILEGECVMTFKEGNIKRMVARLEKGSIVGEETALFDRPSSFTVTVTSNTLMAGKIKNTDLQTIYPNKVVQMMRNYYSERNLTRKKLADFTHPCLGTTDLILSPKNFPLASPKAKEHMTMIMKRVPSFAKENLSEKLMNFSYKGKLEKLRDTANKRISRFLAKE
ncbi:unnamed protein product [Blepharisma stoltei]|uniref:Cyclic nucleotide-binding domain-containing protein n=1 Tax=Blepharisma stoltei TaxID=1481888 RepID=A0AAU9JIJ7_9CILI|nr:unnamed protein product [Blepharisma stoltei]